MKRIQRKRTKGWRMPENTVYVGRGSKWGNPFTVDEFGLEKAISMYRHCLKSPHIAYCYIDEIAATEVYNRFVWMNGHIYQLKGNDLACWCPLDKPCHADVLLEKLIELNP